MKKITLKSFPIPKLWDTNVSRILEMSPEFPKIKKFWTPTTLL